MTIRYVFDADGYLTGVSDGVGVQENTTDIPPTYVDGFVPQFKNGAWIDQTAAPKISPVQFKLLFAPAERVAMGAAQATDPVLQDFFGIVNDPRLTFVDLGLQSTKDAVAYLVGKKLITQARADEVLAGIVK